jgi:catechol 2,3-dioxygenase-like lactoylglutathione lyase family enzyme
MNSRIKILAYAYTAYPVTDIARARAFYEDLLGLRVSFRWEDEHNHWFEYDLGGHTLALVAGVAEWNPDKDGPSVALEVEDFDLTVAALREAGTTFVLEPLVSPVCRMAAVLDPEGNGLIIHRRKAEAPADYATLNRTVAEKNP